MKLLEFLRRDAGMTQRKLSEAAHVSIWNICNAEHNSLVLSDKSLQKLAGALNWKGKPEDLVKDIHIEF